MRHFIQMVWELDHMDGKSIRFDDLPGAMCFEVMPRTGEYVWSPARKVWAGNTQHVVESERWLVARVEYKEGQPILILNTIRNR